MRGGATELSGSCCNFAVMIFWKNILRLLMSVPPVVLSALAVAGMLWLTLAPDPLPDETPVLFPGADKIAHFLMFGVIAALLALDFYRLKGSRRAWLTGAFVSGLLGGVIEIVQDWAADVAGAIVGALIMKYMAGRWPDLIRKNN